jgi:hypothetical protein
MGLVEDRDTDVHVDGLAQYVRPGVVMLSVAAGDDDPNAPRFEEDRKLLEGVRDARGRRLEVMDGPVNGWVDLDGVGPTVIPYMNHYLANGAVIVPVGHIPGDDAALDLLSKAYPDREVVGVPGALISFGGGGPHCITQQGSRRIVHQLSRRWKHDRSPVWHAAPSWWTRARSTSPSQSARSSSQCWTWPDVSPLRQSSCRERLQ